jgi:flagellar motility protein MotE (MotC chaperone)
VNPDVNQVAAIVTAAVALSGAALQWASAYASRKGQQHAARKEISAEIRTDRDGIIDQLQEDLDRYRAWFKESEEKRQAEREAHRQEIDRLDERIHAAVRELRGCKVRIFDLEMALKALDANHPLLPPRTP